MVSLDTPARGSPPTGGGYCGPVMETLLGGRYRLDEPIGRGGMASVWRATDTVLHRQVAVKRLHAGLAADDELSERFLREALLVARLSHPNLVHVLDRGEDADGPYLVLELVEGETLKARVRREGPLAPEEAARICAQVAHALMYAHGQGVIHRDIKAQNVLVSADGTAKLADFGIARMIEGDAQGGLTRTDMLLGSADYLSPEQAAGHALDARTDIYSLGIVLYECLTCTLPFTGDGFVAVAMKHCTVPLPDPRTVRPDLPDWIAQIAIRACEKDPDRRFASAGSMAAALEAGPEGGGHTAMFPALSEAGRTAPSSGRGRGPGPGGGDTATERRRRRGSRVRRWALAALAVLLVAAAALGTGWYLTDGTSDGDDGPAVERTPGPLTITAVRDLDPEPDGDGSENPASRDLVWDGDAETAWFTERYQDSPAFGGLKNGVGLLLRLPRPAALTEVVIDSPTPGATFQIQGVAAGGERPVLAESTLTGGRQTVQIAPGPAFQNHIVWFTSLAPDDSGRYHAGIAEIELRGVEEPAGD